jgi:hypothetical protein
LWLKWGQFKYLVEKCHVEINQQDNDGNTALLLAMSKIEPLETVRYSIEECHADPYLKNKKGRTVFLEASERKKAGVVVFLENYSALTRWQSQFLLGTLCHGGVHPDSWLRN